MLLCAMLCSRQTCPKRGKTGMRRESIIIFVLSALISAGIVGALSYSYHRSLPKDSAIESSKSEASNSIPAQPPSPQVTKKRTRKPTQRLLAYPQKCIDPNGKVIYTNQPDCANAAPTSTLSVVDSVPAKPRTDAQAKSRSTPDDHRAKKPSLQLGTAASAPRDSPIECRFPVGKALEIERSLSAAKDPAESIWKKSYCKWIKEARRNRCQVSREIFYYLDICPIGY